VITAEAEAGYFLTDPDVEWTFDFTDASCGQVLGDSTPVPPTTGHILSTNTNVPNTLPNTGAPATNAWLTIVAAVITFLAVHEITRKKFPIDQN
jgi:LPXTG-motif cell wall-anchored protein